ncbi:vitamin K epoxide reductase complex subunit 1-like protein 1 [Episyrphus balteatus]|uniref:vitamin K epoxide reductase complex subunit 1-like protein 1 n=1 Tax=Episyrphus balteatus TaxID=286459 RepID=UPI0024864885|nr:vitamin K epoxide reductase complex subunit 1-like protein 1 [Episyrphus balteatus]XP_055843219.1 vitamin K epoxide reductase complex subunit 1-like protein 1 [Episyrphus balteatus]XP_055843220.1 vitamin K epoxide reductase complex subunit 1-like protein 1 [Episyrphus balteatus]
MTRSEDDNVDRHVSQSLSSSLPASTSSPPPTTLPHSSLPPTTKTTNSNSISFRRAISRPPARTTNTVGMILTCLIGLALSGYATYVEIRVEKDDDYQAMCDISEKISCTKVFASRYGKGFGIIGWILGEESLLNTPNGELGIVFYIVIGILSLVEGSFSSKIQLFLAILSNCMSIYLAYLLYFVLDNLCVVCVGTYGVNLVLLLLTWQRLKSFVVTAAHFDVDVKLD